MERKKNGIIAMDTSNRDVLLTLAADLEALIGLWPEFEKEFGRRAA